MAINPPPIVRVLEDELRRRFNDGLYWERTQRGELSAIALHDRHPSLTVAGEPFCTRSQMISYRDLDDNEVARVHQYLRTNGSLGASGKPDPKRLYENGILYRLIKKDKRVQADTPEVGDNTAKAKQGVEITGVVSPQSEDPGT